MSAAARPVFAGQPVAARCRYTRVDTMLERCPAWACTPCSTIRFAQAGQARCRSSWQVPWSSRPAAGAVHDLVQSFDRQRPAPSRPLQHHKQPVGRAPPRPLVAQYDADRGEELVAHRHDPLMAALALSHEHPPLGDTQILQAQADHLAAAQPANSHGLHHGPIPLRAQRSTSRPPPPGPRCAADGAPPAPAARSATPCGAGPPGRQAPRHRVGLHPHIPTGDQIRIDGRHRAKRRAIVAADSPASPSAIRTTFSLPPRGRRWAVTNAITSAGRTSTELPVTTVKNAFRSCATPAPCSAGPGQPRTPISRPPAGRPAGNGPGQSPTPNAQDTGSCSFQHLPSV